MATLFEVAPEEVADLRDTAFASLLNDLLALEAQRAGIPQNEVHLTWKQHTPDGGIDASVRTGDKTPEWIPHGESIWQFKSGHFLQGEVAGEISSHPLVIAALRRGARYVLALSRECTEELRVDFESRLEEALAGT
jgi:hypothetical protein